VSDDDSARVPVQLVVSSFVRVATTSGQGVNGLGKLAGETFVRFKGTCCCGKSASRVHGLSAVHSGLS
jgi:hypothetical protein